MALSAAEVWAVHQGLLNRSRAGFWIVKLVRHQTGVPARIVQKGVIHAAGVWLLLAQAWAAPQSEPEFLSHFDVRNEGNHHERKRHQRRGQTCPSEKGQPILHVLVL